MQYPTIWLRFRILDEENAKVVTFFKLLFANMLHYVENTKIYLRNSL